MLPTLRLELESVRHDLVEEKADREEDLRLKDGEIAALSSKVTCFLRLGCLAHDFCFVSCISGSGSA